MKFSNKLYDLRKKNGFSQEELADKLNITRQTISKWELGESTPDMEKLIMISDLFNISLDELVLDRTTEITDEKSSFYDRVAVISKNVLTVENKRRMIRVFKILLIIFLVILAIDIISILVYFFVNGAPIE